ncbi:MAG: glycosyltransferase, partial [Ignavibacteriaceae bacterium]|nr:glycosyltransferase [Ignavibacteriaceae bacterium]
MKSDNINPLVSVIITSYNSEKYIEEAVMSVAAQSYTNLEIIIVDDGSADETRRIALNLQSRFTAIQFYQIEHSGLPSVVRNFGINKSTGEYIAFLDADDKWTSKKIKKQVEHLSNNSDDVLCYAMNITFGAVNVFSPNYELLPLPWKAAKNLTELLTKGNPIPLSTVLVRSDMLKKAGGFDEDPELKIEDYDLWIRLGEYGNYGFINRVFTYYRIHESQFSSDWETKKNRLEYLAKKRNLNLPPYKFYRNKNIAIRLARNFIHFLNYTWVKFLSLFDAIDYSSGEIKTSEKKRKILVVSVADSWGGGEEFLLRLFENLTGYQFIIASPPGESFNTFNRSDVDVVQVNSLKKLFRSQNKWTLASKLNAMRRIAFSTVALIRIIINNKPSFILANGNFAALYFLPTSLLTFKKLLAIQHLIYQEQSVEEKILRLLNRFVYKFVCVSYSVEDNIRGVLKDRIKNNIVTIRHAIKLPAINRVEKRQDDVVKIGIVGSIIRVKAIETVITALHKILEINKNVQLRIYGTVRTSEPDSLVYENELKALIDKMGVSENICFCGFEKSKEKIYSDIDIVVNYSKIAESFSFTVLEAMAFGKIVLAADVGGPKEIITDGYDGFLITPSNDAEFFIKLK